MAELMPDDLFDVILQLVKQVRRNPGRVATLTTVEYLAVALVLDRPDLWHQNQHNSELEAAERIGPAWQQAALQVQRSIG